MPANGRSSSASHFSKDFRSATAGSAENQIFGIPLDNDIRNAPTWQLYGLCVLLLVLLIKPKFASRGTSVAFWVGVGTAVGVLSEVTLLPLLTTIVYTRTAYPYLVVISHCISANASYRSVNGDQAGGVQALLFGFFLYGFGGSIVSDVLMGLPATALAHPRIVPCHVLGWALVWFSPLDWVYKTYIRSDSFLHYFIVAAEAVDAVTTPMGRIGRGARELQNKRTAPIMGGLFAGIGGGIIRFVTGEGGTTFAALQTGFYKTMGYSLLFWTLAVYRCDAMLEPDSDAFDLNHCSSHNGSDILRVVIVSAHVFWTLLCETGLATGHPFVWACQKIFHGKVGATMASTLRLGPQGHEKED
jgi:hypothetical protein